MVCDSMSDWGPAGWPHAFPSLGCTAAFKVQPEDFDVDEIPLFEPAGHGEHLYLRVEKRAQETRHLARQLAELYRVPTVDVGYAGMKDKRAVTRQWFSVSTPQAAQVACEAGVTVLDSSRHERKLRRGQLAANAFAIRLRDVRGEGWSERLEVIGRRGVPNYFGPQRFGGEGGDNLARAQDWLPHRRRRALSRFKQGLYLSVLRGYLFNEVLARRVSDGSWCNTLPGDVVEERGPTGPLWGRGRSPSADEAGAVEAAALAPHAELCDGLEYAGVRQQRRALTLRPEGLEWEADAGDVRLRFRLPPGCYATSLLMEIFALESPA